MDARTGTVLVVVVYHILSKVVVVYHAAIASKVYHVSIIRNVVVSHVTMV